MATKKTNTKNTDEQPTPKSVISAARKKAYGKTQSNGDDIATALTAATVLPVEGAKRNAISIKAMAGVAGENGIDMTRWAHLNLGMQRMNLGNVLRKNAKHLSVGALIEGKTYRITA